MLQMVTRFCCATFVSALDVTRRGRVFDDYLLSMISPIFCRLNRLNQKNCCSKSKSLSWYTVISWIFVIYDLSHLFQTEPTDPKSIVDQNPKVYPDTPIFDGLVMITISMGAIILKHVIHLNNIKPPCQIYWVGTDWGSNPVDGSSNFRQTQKEIWKRTWRKKSNRIGHNMSERKGQPYDIFRKREIFSFSLVFTVCSEM